jgi:hypothetical protein
MANFGRMLGPLFCALIFYKLIIFSCPNFANFANFKNAYLTTMASTNGQMPGINVLAGLTIASQNCNSLNMSHSTKQNQLLKIEALASLRADIIFLSDLRLGNKNSTGSTGDISRLFLMNSTGTYDFLSNSTKNKRGVGILLKKDMAIKTLRTIPDP